jgi:hypothetical protein
MHMYKNMQVFVHVVVFEQVDHNFNTSEEREGLLPDTSFHLN